MPNWNMKVINNNSGESKTKKFPFNFPARWQASCGFPPPTPPPFFGKVRKFLVLCVRPEGARPKRSENDSRVLLVRARQ